MRGYMSVKSLPWQVTYQAHVRRVVTKMEAERHGYAPDQCDHIAATIVNQAESVDRFYPPTFSQSQSDDDDQGEQEAVLTALSCFYCYTDVAHLVEVWNEVEHEEEDFYKSYVRSD